MQTAQLLAATRVTRIMQGIDDPRLKPGNLLWSKRVPTRNAMDGEINAKTIGVTEIADLVADDAAAVIRTSGRVVLESYKLPNLKTGIGFTQEMLNLLAKLNTVYASSQELDFAVNRVSTAASKAVDGVEHRKEHLIATMLCDGVGMTYDRLGIKLTAPSWGMPSDLKVTAGTTWDVAATATPVQDIWTVKNIASRRYGVNLNRVTMSTPAFQLMIATTEFQNKAKVNVPAHLTFTNLNTLNLDQMRALASGILGMQLELSDARFWQETIAGVKTSYPFVPLGNVILTDSGNDGNPDVFDFANATVTESIVAQAAGGVLGGVFGNIPQGFGPIGYATVANANLNPPGINVWGVARGWPRRFLLGASAVINVGTVTDTISTDLPI